MIAHRERSATRRVIVHGHADEHQHLASTVSANMLTEGRAMGLLSVGYHYVIEPDGKIVRHSPEHCIGAHTPGHNQDSIGVWVAHSDLAYAAAVQLCLYLTGNYEPRLSVVGHDEITKRRNKPACPWFDMGEFRKRLNIEEAPLLSEQQRIIMEQLKAGRSLTPKIAIIEWGIGSLTSRIAELRHSGHPIKGEWREDTHGKRYMKYRLEEVLP